MSVFGGDSWAREAQYRKRRVDDLMIEGVPASSYKRLPNGKLACLVCPKNPVLDTPIMLATHVRGSRHRANELRHKDKQFAKREEVNKQIALSDGSSMKLRKTNSVPLIERARKAAAEVVRGGEVSTAEVRSEMGSRDFCTLFHEGELKREVDVCGLLPLDWQKRREMELKFTSAGWKRDCHGKWFKDENVEFDSDEEDPNTVLNSIT